jgi:maltose O-acetyltransferase
MNTTKLFLASKIFHLIPETRFFPLKSKLLRWCGAKIGQNVRITSSARFICTGDLSIGDDVWIGEQTLIVGGSAAIRIGSQVDIGPRVTLVTGTHKLWEDTMRAAGSGYSRPIIIEDGVWIGCGSIVLGGISVGRGTAIAAGSVVIRDAAPHSLYAGNPATLKKIQT